MIAARLLGCQVHFEGWNPRWDIWLDVSTDAGMKRVAKAFRHTGKATDVGAPLVVVFQASIATCDSCATNVVNKSTPSC